MIIQGKAHWAKIVGEPVWGYKNAHKEWSMDFCVDAKAREKLLAEGMDPSYIKNKGDERGDFITFRRRSVKRDGTEAKPIEIKTRAGADWDGKTRIGNGSTVNVKIALNDVEGKKGTKPSLIKVQVWELVPYAGGDDEDFPVGDDEDWAND